jgi:hypothetical protein
MGDVVALDATPLPTPSLEGPFFAHFDAVLTQSNDSSDANQETSQLQRALSRFGYYRNQPVDGIFGEHTLNAVKMFQKFSGVAVDGAVGPITKALMLSSRFDTLVDIDPAVPIEIGGGGVDVSASTLSSQNGSEFTSDKRNIFPSPGSNVVKFKVGVVPGYLVQSEVETEISKVLMQWGYATGFEFMLAKDDDVIQIRFAEPNDMDQNLFRFDGPGGCIAHADVEKKLILLDSSERWVVNSSDNSSSEVACDTHFDVATVVFHEMGHILGLCAHSPHAEDVMCPFYISGGGRGLVLGPSDLKRISKLYNDTPEVGLVLKRPVRKT